MEDLKKLSDEHARVEVLAAALKTAQQRLVQKFSVDALDAFESVLTFHGFVLMPNQRIKELIDRSFQLGREAQHRTDFGPGVFVGICVGLAFAGLLYWASTF